MGKQKFDELLKEIQESKCFTKIMQKKKMSEKKFPNKVFDAEISSRKIPKRIGEKSEQTKVSEKWRNDPSFETNHTWYATVKTDRETLESCLQTTTLSQIRTTPQNPN
jgi:hypothetical protein